MPANLPLLDRLERLRAEATAGEWRSQHHFSCHSDIFAGQQKIFETDCNANREAQHVADADFAAALVNHADVLIRAARALEVMAERGHHDTCALLLSSLYECNCGFSDATAILAELARAE